MRSFCARIRLCRPGQRQGIRSHSQKPEPPGTVPVTPRLPPRFRSQISRLAPVLAPGNINAPLGVREGRGRLQCADGAGCT